jgi:hypothetical protein
MHDAGLRICRPYSDLVPEERRCARLEVGRDAFHHEEKKARYGTSVAQDRASCLYRIDDGAWGRLRGTPVKRRRGRLSQLFSRIRFGMSPQKKFSNSAFLRLSRRSLCARGLGLMLDAAVAGQSKPTGYLGTLIAPLSCISSAFMQLFLWTFLILARVRIRSAVCSLGRVWTSFSLPTPDVIFPPRQFNAWLRP